MRVHIRTVGPFQMNCYVVADEATRSGLVIDPGDGIESILELIRSEGLDIRAILLTHGHLDHVARAQELKEALGVRMHIHEADRPMLAAAPQQALMFGLPPGPVPQADGTLAEGDLFEAGSVRLRVLHTPGHSPGGICLVADGAAFVGDALFAGSIGRTDLPGGDHETLIRSIKEKILTLGDHFRLYPGHGPPTTVAREKANNPFL